MHAHALHKHRIGQAVGQKALVAGKPQQHALAHSRQQLAPGFFAVAAVRHDLGHHRVVVRADLSALAQCTVDAHIVVHRRPPAQHRAGLRQKASGHVFGRQPHLHRVTLQADVGLLPGQGLPTGHTQLPLHQIQPGDGFGHRVFDLEPGVHLHEIKLPLGVEQKLHGACADVAHGAGAVHRHLPHACPQLGVHGGRGRFFDQLLVTPLHRAVALTQVHHMPVAVGQQLDLDMAWGDEGTLQNQLVRPKSRARFRTGRGQRRRQCIGRVHPPHAAPAATGSGFAHDGKADARCFKNKRFVALILTFVAGNAGHAPALHQPLGPGLVAHGADAVARRADEHQARCIHRVGKGVVFRQKTIARVHCVGPGQPGGGEDGLDVQVGLCRRCRADAHRALSRLHVRAVTVDFGIHGHRAIAQAAHGAQHAQRNLAAVGHQHGVEGADVFGCVRGHGGQLAADAGPGCGAWWRSLWGSWLRPCRRATSAACKVCAQAGARRSRKAAMPSAPSRRMHCANRCAASLSQAPSDGSSATSRDSKALSERLACGPHAKMRFNH